MRKTNLRRAVAVIAVLAVLSFALPGTVSAKVSAEKFNFKRIIKNPVTLLASLFSFIPVFGEYSNADQPDNPENNNIRKIKVTGGLTAVRPSEGD
jgi:hypothetical protein